MQRFSPQLVLPYVLGIFSSIFDLLIYSPQIYIYSIMADDSSDKSLDTRKYSALSPTADADGLPRSQFMNMNIRELWPQIPRVAGPTYAVRCPPATT